MGGGVLHQSRDLAIGHHHLMPCPSPRPAALNSSRMSSGGQRASTAASACPLVPLVDAAETPLKRWHNRKTSQWRDADLPSTRHIGDCSGMETRDVSGRNQADAMRTFLAELDEQTRSYPATVTCRKSKRIDDGRPSEPVSFTDGIAA